MLTWYQTKSSSGFPDSLYAKKEGHLVRKDTRILELDGLIGKYGSSFLVKRRFQAGHTSWYHPLYNFWVATWNTIVKLRNRTMKNRTCFVCLNFCIEYSRVKHVTWYKYKHPVSITSLHLYSGRWPDAGKLLNPHTIDVITLIICLKVNPSVTPTSR